MKSELATAIVAAIAGVLLSYFVTGLFTGELTPVGIKTVNSNVATDYSDPNPEVFNYESLNPTVEIYIGNDDASNANSNNNLEGQEGNRENF